MLTKAMQKAVGDAVQKIIHGTYLERLEYLEKEVARLKEICGDEHVARKRKAEADKAEAIAKATQKMAGRIR